MSLFVISDLHLSTNQTTNKSMEVFGPRWKDYISKIEKNWNSVISENDTVVIPGDISWALTLEEARSDLGFVNSLNGKKLLGKGNHDFWWATNKKMNEFFAANGYDSLHILHNNAYIADNYIVCGTRCWFPEESQQTAVNNADYDKIIRREVGRLVMSLECAKKLQNEHFEKTGELFEILVFLHFPPIRREKCIEEFVDVLTKYEIKRVYYGHIHNSYDIPRIIEYQNIKFILTSSDFLSFYPLKI